MSTNKELFLRHQGQTSNAPMMVEIESSKGIYLFGKNGEKYIDLISGIGPSVLGHQHSKIVEAIKAQIDQHMHVMVYGEYVQSPQAKLAEKLATKFSQKLSVSFFVNSGSEAIEGALKLAKRYTGKPDLVSCKNSYHGSSHGCLSVGGDENQKRAFRPLLPGVKHIQFGDISELKTITENTAGFIIETIQGEAGVQIADKNYWKAVRERCDETNTLLILDEVQCGVGRTGKFSAFEHYGIEPDIVCLAKGLGGGMPIGAFISSKEIMQSLEENPVLGHITTFGGHPVSCASALATLEALDEEKTLDSVNEKSELFRKHLSHPKIKEIRNLGLLMAVEFGSFDIVKKIIDDGVKNGLLTDWFLFCNTSIRVAPPLNISDSEIIDSCRIITKILDTL